MHQITLHHNENNILQNKYFAVLQPATDYRLNDLVHVFFKEEDKGTFKIADMYARESIDDIADHLCWLAYGVSKTTFVATIKKYYRNQTNKNINKIKFQWLIITTEIDKNFDL